MESIIVTVPSKHKGLAAAMQRLVDVVTEFEQRAPRERTVNYRCHERELAEAAGAVEREGHAGSLAALDIDAPRVRIDGLVHHRVGRHEALYKTRVGEVAVTRTLYRPSGTRPGSEQAARAVNTVSLRIGAVEDEWLPDTASAMAFRIARGTSREAEQASVVEGTLPYSRSSFERIGHAVGSKMSERRVDIEETLVAEMEIPREAASISVALDRTAVPMEEPKKRPVGRPRKGAPKRPVDVVYRMAWTGTVTLHDALGEALDTIRYGRMPQEDGDLLAEALASDALALKRRRPDLRVVTLGDGAPDVQALLEKHIDPETFGPNVCRLVDMWHLVEKLGAAGKVIAPDSDERKRLLGNWRPRLCTHQDAPDVILQALRDSGKEHVCVGEDRPVHQAMTYLVNQRHLMGYVEARALGLPIGSGNVEATCKSLFGMRLKRPGARWHESTGAEVITMRAHLLSARWRRAAELALPASRHEISRAA